MENPILKKGTRLLGGALVSKKPSKNKIKITKI